MTKNEEKYFLGIDVGSISTNLALINNSKELVDSIYIRTDGKPIRSKLPSWGNSM